MIGYKNRVFVCACLAGGSREACARSQVRVGTAEAPALLQRLTSMTLTWAEAQATFPAQPAPDSAE